MTSLNSPCRFLQQSLDKNSRGSMDTRVSKQTRELIPGHPSCLAWSTNVFGLHMPAVLGWQKAKFSARSSSGRCSETVYSLMEYRQTCTSATSLSNGTSMEGLVQVCRCAVSEETFSLHFTELDPAEFLRSPTLDHGSQ